MKHNLEPVLLLWSQRMKTSHPNNHRAPGKTYDKILQPPQLNYSHCPLGMRCCLQQILFSNCRFHVIHNLSETWVFVNESYATVCQPRGKENYPLCVHSDLVSRSNILEILALQNTHKSSTRKHLISIKGLHSFPGQHLRVFVTIAMDACVFTEQFTVVHINKLMCTYSQCYGH